MRYLVVTTSDSFPPFLTDWFDPLNHWQSGMVVVDLYTGKVMRDGANWETPTEDSL